MNAMKTSAAGIAALEAREGKRFVAYLDSQKVATIGVGHTGRMAPPAVHLGMTITQAECDAFLRADLAPVEKIINGLGVALTQNQFDACASLAFNIGAAGFQRSTVAKLLHEGKTAQAADAFLLWDKPAELKTRREAERRQFLKPDAVPVPSAESAPGGTTFSSVQPVDKSVFLTPGQVKTSSGDTTPLSQPVPGSAKPTAPAAAVQATPTAAQKAPTMTATATAAKSSTALTPIAGIFGSLLTGIETKLKDTAAAITSGTANAAGAATVATEAVGSAPNALAAAEDIAKLVVEVETHDWADIPKTAADFLAKLAAILANFKITLPGLTEVQSILAKFVG